MSKNSTRGMVKPIHARDFKNGLKKQTKKARSIFHLFKKTHFTTFAYFLRVKVNTRKENRTKKGEKEDTVTAFTRLSYI